MREFLKHILSILFTVTQNMSDKYQNIVLYLRVEVMSYIRSAVFYEKNQKTYSQNFSHVASAVCG